MFSFVAVPMPANENQAEAQILRSIFSMEGSLPEVPLALSAVSTRFSRVSIVVQLALLARRSRVQSGSRQYRL